MNNIHFWQEFRIGPLSKCVLIMFDC